MKKRKPFFFDKSVWSIHADVFDESDPTNVITIEASANDDVQVETALYMTKRTDGSWIAWDTMEEGKIRIEILQNKGGSINSKEEQLALLLLKG